jgi:hypothetical protein
VVKFGSVSMAAAAALSFAVVAPGEAATSVYNFTGTCGGSFTDCTGTINATLTLSNYVEGNDITSGNVVGFSFNDGATHELSRFEIVDWGDASFVDGPDYYFALSAWENINGVDEYRWDVRFDSLDQSWGIYQVEVGPYYLGDGPSLTPAGVAAVPEPATWAMMLIGFGAIGAFMRRQRSAIRTTVSYA